MRRIFLFAAIVLAAGLAWAQAKPTTMRIVGEGITAHIAFEKGVKMTLTSKPTPVRPDTYWTLAMSLFKKDDKGRTWEMRSNGAFGGFANVTVDAEQDKVLLLGKPVGIMVEGKPAEDPPGNNVIAVSIVLMGQSGEQYFPWAFLDGKHTMPSAAVKDENGKVLAAGVCQIREGRYAWFTWKYPPGWRGKFDVDAQVFLGPFEAKPSKAVTPFQ